MLGFVIIIFVMINKLKNSTQPTIIFFELRSFFLHERENLDRLISLLEEVIGSLRIVMLYK